MVSLGLAANVTGGAKLMFWAVAAPSFGMSAFSAWTLSTRFRMSGRSVRLFERAIELPKSLCSLNVVCIDLEDLSQIELGGYGVSFYDANGRHFLPKNAIPHDDYRELLEYLEAIALGGQCPSNTRQLAAAAEGVEDSLRAGRLRVHLRCRRHAALFWEFAVLNLVVFPWTVLLPGMPAIGWQFLLGHAYLIVRDLAGPSPGKRALGLRLVTCENPRRQAPFGRRLLRNLVYLIPLMPILEVFFLASGKGETRLGDRISRTKVVHVSPDRLQGTYEHNMVLSLLISTIAYGLFIAFTASS
jgi:uncharacterized RDD family membrane protein YckC